MAKTNILHNVPFIDLRTEDGFEGKVKLRWENALKTSQFISGKAVAEFSAKVLDFTGASFFAACANGTDALQIALRAAGVGKDDIVLLPDFTFWATYEAVLNVGGNPVMVDISAEDYQMDFELFVKAAEKYQPKAAILVHLYGWSSSRLKDFRNFCKKKNIQLIEDGAQAIGSLYEDESIFKSAFLVTTSFYPAKVLGAAGDAGGIFTNNREIGEICTKLINHGRSSHYGHEYVGWNSRMDELQAHYLCEAIEYLPQRIDSRRDSEKKYLEFGGKHKGLPLEMKHEPSNVKGNGYLQVSLATTNYADLAKKLKEKGIGSGNVYPSPMSAQLGAKTNLNGKSIEPLLVSNDKIAYEISNKVLNLPLFPYMKDEEINYVCEALKGINF